MWVNLGVGWCDVGVVFLFIYVVVAMVYSIGRGIGYKKSELCDLSDGSTLIVGGKEVEVSMCMCACVRVYVMSTSKHCV